MVVGVLSAVASDGAIDAGGGTPAGKRLFLWVYLFELYIFKIKATRKTTERKANEAPQEEAPYYGGLYHRVWNNTTLNPSPPEMRVGATPLLSLFMCLL